MTSPVRPPIFPPAHAALGTGKSALQAGGDAGRTAAQKAFFEIAMGRAPAPAAAAAPAAPSAPAAVAQSAPKIIQKTPHPAADPPARILRPGSLLDIRV